MKNFTKILTLAVATLAMASVGAAATITLVDVHASYGTPLSPTGVTTAAWVSLASLGITTPGTSTVNFSAVGGLCFNAGGSPPCLTDVAVSSITNPILGGFSAASSSTTFLSTGLAQFNTISSGDWSNDIANDFIITSSGTGVITVPTGANYVVFVFRDSFYQDNQDNSPIDFGVSSAVVNPGGVPEPATYAMMLAGLGAVAAFKRFRRS
jgi:hypothetical protein